MREQPEILKVTPPEPAADDADPANAEDQILHRIISSREKMPHNPRWMAARQRALWHYVARQQERMADNQQADSEKKG